MLKWNGGGRSVRGRWLWNLLGVLLVVAVCSIAAPRYEAHSAAGVLAAERVAAAGVAADEEPVVNPNSTWKVNVRERVSACDNRPGLKKIYVTVLDEWGDPLRGVIVRFEPHASEGVAYDHQNIWGYTDRNGYLEWNHLGVPTRYMLFMESDVVALVENIRTDLGNEYCKPPGPSGWTSNVPVNRPGIYSYRIAIQLKGE